jgi:hypothetical protein
MVFFDFHVLLFLRHMTLFDTFYSCFCVQGTSANCQWQEKLLGLLQHQDQEEAPKQGGEVIDKVMHEASESSSKEEVGHEGVSSHVSPTC